VNDSVPRLDHQKKKVWEAGKVGMILSEFQVLVASHDELLAMLQLSNQSHFFNWPE